MKLVALTILITIGCLSFQNPARQVQTMNVYFLDTFENDSLHLRLSDNNDYRLKVSSVAIIDSTKPLEIAITPADSIITITDVTSDNNYTVKNSFLYKNLFIYYDRSKFTFRFSNKLIFIR